MAAKRKKTIASTVLHIEGELTILRAAELKGALLANPPPTELDLSGVTDIDTAGMQLLMLADREARTAGRSLRITSPSTAVRELLALFKLPLCVDEPLAAER